MSTISDQYIEIITKRINESKIESAEMKEDLIDHFCCAVEEEMEKGKSFERSYEKAFNNICPDGFDEIRKETIFILTTKKNKAMKRLLYFSGYLTAIGITTTVFMKLSHIAGGQIVFLLTEAILVFFFLPVLFINLYKRDLTKSISDKLKYVSGFLGVVLLLAFSVFKLSHWSGATIFFLLSLAIINFAFFPLMFFKMYNKSVKK
jgi:hypothetical protein